MMRHCGRRWVSTRTSGIFGGVACFAALSLSRTARPKRRLTQAGGIAARIKKEAFAAGLICYPMSGTIDGQRGDHVLLAPPFIIEDAQVDELVDKIFGAIDRAIAA